MNAYRKASGLSEMGGGLLSSSSSLSSPGRDTPNVSGLPSLFSRHFPTSSRVSENKRIVSTTTTTRCDVLSAYHICWPIIASTLPAHDRRHRRRVLYYGRRAPDIRRYRTHRKRSLLHYTCVFCMNYFFLENTITPV